LLILTLSVSAGSDLRADGLGRFLDKICGWKVYQDGSIKIRKVEREMPSVEGMSPQARKMTEDLVRPYTPYYFQVQREEEFGQEGGDGRHGYRVDYVHLTLADIAGLKKLNAGSAKEGEKLELQGLGRRFLERGKGQWKLRNVWQGRVETLMDVHDHELDWLLDRLDEIGRES